MKHATDKALELLEDLLERVRARDGLKEKSGGVFYRKSRAFLHFHEDPTGLYADLRVTGEFERYPVNTDSERAALLAEIDRACKREDATP
jgi:hypothetical protein